MGKENVAMSAKELERLQVIQDTVNRQITQEQAAHHLNITIRQVKRLVKKYRTSGAEGLISRRRGMIPNNAFSSQFRSDIIALINNKYSDFGPTFASEKLLENHGYNISSETLRKWMIEEGIWKTNKRKKARIHPRRMRRPCFGELIQIDGSPHDWFEGRAPRCSLIVFIDDATSSLMALRFSPSETTQVYMETLRGYISEHGIPLALYSDKHSIFRINHSEREGELTQFTRAIKELKIEPIHANTPQAKGRVERANQTLQDRLVKELRLHGINDIENANKWLPDFILSYNYRFASPPFSEENVHRVVEFSEEELDLIFCYRSQRILSKNLTFQYKSSIYQLRDVGNGYRLRHTAVTVCEDFEGGIIVLHNNKKLKYTKYFDGPAPIPLDDEKSVHERVDNARLNLNSKFYVKPAKNHPWQRSFKSKKAGQTPQ